MRLCLALTLAVLACSKRAEHQPVRVAAASDLTRAFEALGQKLGTPVTFSFGSSGLLSKQLVEGAPFDVFASANVAFVDSAVKAGVCDGATAQPYARGRLAVWSKAGPVMLEELGDEKLHHIAIANPEHAPYGKAAKEALIAAGLWERVEKRLVYAENIRQTLQLAETGNVEAAVVALALVKGDPHAVLVDAAKHQPLVQGIVVCTKGENRTGGEAFVKLVRSEEGQAVLKRYGFEPP
ncbi:MAG: molybdate ABC transporter substrate-binding protein [Myxococcaceae bacterium]|nr:molybdate ABC transporter substrate-binding protein [Myxococcaceae bacterium]